MKKLFFLLITIGFVVLLWLQIRSTARIQMTFLVGETHTLARGDLTIPIEATGTVEPRDRMEIKSEAGGRVVRTPYEVGNMVQAGDLLVELDPEDEQRAVDRATRAVDQARINLNQAKAALEQRRQDVPRIEGLIKANNADLDYWTWRFTKWEKLKEEGIATHEDEVLQIRANRDKFDAQNDQLKAQLEQARQAVELARLDVGQGELALKQAETDLGDFQERLDETSIIAPSDGMLLSLLVKKGSVIASASTSFTGGTPLAMLADVSELYVRALVDEADIGRVYDIAPPEARPGSTHKQRADADAEASQEVPDLAGQPVKITVEAYPEESFEGIIELIEPEPNRNPGEIVVSYAVRIRLTSEEVGKLFIGMQATVEFLSESVADAVLVPNEAVRIQAGERGVYTPVDSQVTPGKKVPEFVPFKAGLDNGMYTQVLEGLDAGIEVYTKLPRDSSGKIVTGDDAP